MNYLTFIPVFLFFILFFVTLIEYLTGAEKEGLKFFIFFIIFILLVSFFFSLEFSKNLAQKFVEMLAGVVSAFK
jgi:hypothetical protein